MLSRVVKSSSSCTSKVTINTISQCSFKRFNSSSHHDDHHHSKESKPVQITMAKIFSIAAIAGGLLVYKNKDNTETPILKSNLIDYQLDGTRANLRDENFSKKYDVGFTKVFAMDNGGIGQTLRKNRTDIPINNNLIPSHSPFGSDFGQGIKLSDLGPRKERLRRFAPIETNQ